MPIDPWNVLSADFGSFAKPYTGFVTLADMVLYLALTFNVGRARQKHNVPAPDIEGPESFKRVFRTHQNTLEQVVMHLPLLWLAAFAMDDAFAAALGAVWILGRILYARGYYQKAKRRAKGFFVCLAANTVLFIGILASLIASL